MADNTFGFELRADDQASVVLRNIGEQVEALQPELLKAQEGLALGGRETQDGLSVFGLQFRDLSRLAKENVQLFGDMVPPLKNVSALGGMFTGNALKFGAIGALSYGAVKGVSALGTAMNAAAGEAYSLEVAAGNAGMSVQDFSQLSGAMRLLGTDSMQAQSAIEGLYRVFNDAVQGRNSQVLAVMSQLNAPIARRADGTADVLKTVESLASRFTALAPQNQKTAADALGLDASGLQLLREGVRLKTLLTKAEKVGLTADPQLTAQLSDFSRATTEAGAAWEGLKQRLSQGLYSFLLSDGSVSDMIKGATDVMANGPDNIALMHLSGLSPGDDAEQLREGYSEPEFMDSLSLKDKVMQDFGLMSDGYRQKYRRYFGLKRQAMMLSDDLSTVVEQTASDPATKTEKPSEQARSVRNNNPWNLRYAGQRGARQADDNFAAFSTPEAGLLAADRQLQLYASGQSKAAGGIPLTSLRSIISVASPPEENNTEQMVRDASRELQVLPDQRLNLSDPAERSRVLNALFDREGNNPWSPEQIEQLITPSRASSSLITPSQSSDNVPAQQMTEQLATALRETGVKVELTLINDQTGERRTLTGSGSRVTTAMTFP